jgi:hypothetical protein
MLYRMYNMRVWCTRKRSGAKSETEEMREGGRGGDDLKTGLSRFFPLTISSKAAPVLVTVKGKEDRFKSEGRLFRKEGRGRKDGMKEGRKVQKDICIYIYIYINIGRKESFKRKKEGSEGRKEGRKEGRQIQPGKKDCSEGRKEG